MAGKRTVKSSNQFCELVIASGLMRRDELDAALSVFRTRAAGRSSDRDAVVAFAEHLVATDALTQWQCEKLQCGKHKGFFLDNFKLVEHHSVATDCSRFIAEDVSTGDRVVLAVTPPTVMPLKNGRPQYVVEPLDG